MTIEMLIEKNFAGMKLEKAIKKKYPTIPMSVIFKLLRKGRIRVNFEVAQKGQILQFGDLISFDIEEKYLDQKKVEISKYMKMTI